MSFTESLASVASKDPKAIEINEEFNNFMKKVGEVSKMVKDLSSGDKKRADRAQAFADEYLSGKVILDDDIPLKVKADRTVINTKAFKAMDNKDTGEMDKDVWMAEMSKDADRRAEDRKVRREKCETFKTRAVKAFRRGDYEKALSCYNHAIEQIKDDAMLYCDRALTNIKLKKFDKVYTDCDWALRLNGNSFKARLYQARAYKELEEFDKMEECKKELNEKFPQHNDLVKYFLEKKDGYYDEDEEEEKEEEEEKNE